jgi:FAD/FMN-containing dehydrogenase
VPARLAPARPVPAPAGEWVDDVHSGLNRTRVREVVRPSSAEEVADVVRRHRRAGRSLSVAGGRHAAGGQQFLTDGTLLDLRSLSRVLSLDAERGIVDAEAGVLWPDLVAGIEGLQEGVERPWAIVQKQGVDRISIGGSLAANMHGNALGEPPIVAQVESFTLVDARGDVRTCSRTSDVETFSRVVGGYGLFGAVTSVRLRLAPRRRLRVTAREVDAVEVIPALDEARSRGALYGDWHYDPNPASPGFLRRGVLTTWAPLGEDEPGEPVDHVPPPGAWLALVLLAHRDPGRAYAAYAEAQLATHGDVVWSDTFQMDRAYVDGYHREVDRALGATTPASESLLEFFVPRERLPELLADVRADLLARGVAPLYGTVRSAERDAETALPWAAVPRAGLVLNFHVPHDEAGIAGLRATFRRLADLALARGGTFYLTYHPFATAAQLDAGHPGLRALLAEKDRADPQGTFASDWERALRRTLGIARGVGGARRVG